MQQPMILFSFKIQFVSVFVNLQNLACERKGIKNNCNTFTWRDFVMEIQTLERNHTFLLSCFSLLFFVRAFQKLKSNLLIYYKDGQEGFTGCLNRAKNCTIANKKKREYEKKFNFKFTIQSAPSTIHSFIHVVNRIIIYASVLQTFLFACVDQSIGTVTFFNGQFLPFSIDA